MEFDSGDNLPLEKTLTVYNVVILIRSVFSTIENHYQ